MGVTGCPAHTAHMATLRELTRWSDPALSGLVAGCGLAFLLSLSLYSAVSVVAYTMLALAMVGLCCKMYVHLMGLLKKPSGPPGQGAAAPADSDRGPGAGWPVLPAHWAQCHTGQAEEPGAS